MVVDKRMKESDGIKYLRMPRVGRMLVGKYEGDYKNIRQLYHSMEKYLGDKHLKKAALPYEKYFTDPHSATDSLHMKIELYYPIF
jgi:effector-binding domain-containing protein